MSRAPHSARPLYVRCSRGPRGRRCRDATPRRAPRGERGQAPRLHFDRKWGIRSGHKGRGYTLSTTIAFALWLPVFIQPAHAQPITHEQILIVGVALQPMPAQQVVPKNTATIVTPLFMELAPGAGQVPQLPADAQVLAELRGPALATPLALSARPNESMQIPPLPLPGLYTLDNIRLVSGGEVLLTAIPNAATIEVVDKVLVSQVTSRPLTAAEIKEKGIVIDQDNFQVINFTAAFGFQDRKVTIDFPMIVPTTRGPSAPVSVPALSLPPLQLASTPQVVLPDLQIAFQTPNVSVSGLLLKVEDSDADERALSIEIPAAVIIPGNVAYLNQFFSVITMVSNVTPAYSNLVVRDLTATISLPAGDDTVPNTSDDPLRSARLGNPPVDQPKIQPIAQLGPDGKLGTSDDLDFLAPGNSGEAEHLIEGRREGTFAVEISLHGTLFGLPGGPVSISGKTAGVVEVRNPTFALTFSHPAITSAGEEYDFFVTATNTSTTPANFLSLNLLPRSISGAVLLSNPSVEVDTVAPGESATATFRLRSLVTGSVTATSFASDGIPGKFDLRMAVGALGIPLSANTLILPPAADALPVELRTAGIGFLGQALALATSPVTPAGLLPLTRAIVYERASDLAQAGQRLGLQEPLGSVARDLLLDFTGNDFSRIAERFPNQLARQQLTEQDFRAFDALLRQSQRGDAFLEVLAGILGDEVQSQGVVAFGDAWAQAGASRPSQIAAVTGSGTGPAPVVLSIVDPNAQRLGQTSASGPITHDVPYGSFLSLIDATPAFSQLGVVAVPQNGAYAVELTGTGGGAFDLGLVVPEGNQLRSLAYQSVPIQLGGKARVRFTIGGSNTYDLQLDDDGDGIADQTLSPSSSLLVADSGPTLVSAVQIVTNRDDISRFGQLIGLLFSEEVSAASSQSGIDPALITNYAVDANEVQGAAIQTGGRVVALALRDGIGPFVPRTVTVSGIEDRLGNPMNPASVTQTIVPTITDDGGTVSGFVRRGDGTSVPGARIRLAQDLGLGLQTISVKEADANGAYSFDYVRLFPSQFEAVDVDSGERGEARTQLRFNGQRLDLDIILLGTGTVIGRALAADGVTPLAGAVVRISSLTRFGEVFSALTDSSGAFAISGIPVGNVTIEAGHAATNSRTLLAAVIPSAGAIVTQDLILLPVAQAALLTGNLKGQVFRADGVTVAANVPVFTTSGGIATTDASGSYRIDGVPIGPVTVKAIDQARLEQGAVTTTVIANTDITANLLLFGGTGSVRGVVLDAGGVPVAGAVVGGGLTLAQTDTSGQFTLPDVPLGSRTITAVDPVRQLSASADVILATPGEEVTVQIILPAQGVLVGRIFEADGVTPVANLKVFVLGPLNLSAVTDANGNYRVDALPLGAYLISAFRSDFSDGNVAQTKLVFKDEVRRTDVVFRGKGRVTGIVLDDDGVTPLGARVGFSELQVKIGLLRPADNTQCIDSYTVGDITVDLPQCESVGIGFESVRLDRIVDNDVASGTFAFDNVFVGNFTVEAANAFSPTIMAASGMIVAPGDTANVILQLTPTSIVTGTVYQPDGMTPVGADLVVTFDSGTLRDVRVVTDAHGRYLFPLVNGGGFSVTAADPVTGLVGQSSGAVEAGRTAEIPIRLLGLGDVMVEVLGSNGLISGAQVTLQRGSFPSEQRMGVTAPDGTVAFTGGNAVSEGPFSVSAFDATSGARGFTSAVAVRDTGVSVQILIPDQAGIVHGRFLKTDGITGIANAQVRLSGARGDAFITTAADGGFLFDGVPLGGFQLEAFDSVTARRGRGSGQLTSNGEDVIADIVEAPQGMVKGIVVLSTDRSPVTGADVSISVASVFGGSFRTSSGVDGTFTFPAVSAGTFNVSATQPLTQFSGSTNGSLSSEGEVVQVEIVIQVPAVGRVEGFITKADGTPAVGVQITLSPPFGPRTTSDNSGFYFFDGVGVGPVTVLATALIGPDAGMSSGRVAFDGDVEHVDVRFIGTGRVTGTVVDGASAPVPFVQVVLTSRNAINRSFMATTQTDLAGAFAFNTVPVGDVSVTATEPVTQLAGTASVNLSTDGATVNVTVMLEPAGELSGRVLREDGVTAAAGLALELTRGAARFGSTDTNGAFHFLDLALGTYQLTVTDPLGSGLARVTTTLAAQGQIVDLGDIILDESAPRVVSITPADAQASVPVNQAIAVQFSEPVDATSINGANLLVSTNGGAVLGVWMLDASGTLAQFTSAALYPDFTRVNIRVTRRVLDRVGKPLAAEVVASFVTADSMPPVTLSSSPAPRARDVPLDAVIRVTYSEAVAPSAFTGAAITLSHGGVLVTGRVDFILNNTVTVFTPSLPLSPNTRYDVAVAPAADVFGNTQSSPRSYSFDTIDTIAPVVQSLTAIGGTSVLAGATVHLVADLGATPDVAFVQFLVNGQVAQTVPALPYGFDLLVTPAFVPTVTIAARATDRSGNVGQLVSLTLMVQADNAPTATITQPLDGATVNTGSQVSVRIHASDDVGVSSVLLQAIGSVNSSFTDSVAPAAATHDSLFSFSIPAQAAPGSLQLRAAALDTSNRASNTAQITLTVRDVTVPTVQIASPAPGTQLLPGDTVTIVVSAQDNDLLASITATASGAATLNQTQPVSPAAHTGSATFMVTVLSNATGNQSLVLNAQARDATGNVGQAATVTLPVRDVVNPVVSLTVPNGVTQVSRGRSVTVHVSATDEVGVATLGFEATGALTSMVATPITPAPLSAANDFLVTVPQTATVGSMFSVIGSATDAAGNKGTSTAVSLSVAADVTSTLQVTKQGTGTGRVTSAPAGIDCGSDCGETYAADQTLTLTAVADADSAFGGWGGDCSGQNNSIVIMVSRDTSCGASFVRVVSQVVFDAAADFSLASNPNGVWSYGASATLGAISLFTVADMPSGFERWHIAPGIPESAGAPAIIRNGTPNPLTTSITVPPGQVVVHPGPNGELSVTRFTAPDAGDYQIDVVFSGGDTATTDVHVLAGGQSLFVGNINGQGDTETFNGGVTLAAGDTIDFAVGFGGNGFFSDSTFITATITKQTCVPPPPDMIAWWSFDETGGTTAGDRVGGNHGTYTNGPATTPGQVRGARRFDGGDDYVSIPDSDLWAFGSRAFTIELWASWDVPGGGFAGLPGDILIGNDEGPGFINKWGLALGGGNLEFYVNGPAIGAVFVQLTPFAPVVGRWYHLALTRQGQVFTMFVDGAAAGSVIDPVVIPNASAPLTIGQAESIGFMNGRLDEVAIYNRALSPSEVVSIFNAGSAGKCTATDPFAIDTDGDGLSDGHEISVYGTDPFNPDTDGDGLGDGEEVNQRGTNPLSADTDGDGLGDGVEVANGLNPRDGSDAAADADGDGLSNVQEITLGTGVRNPDSDGDGLTDGQEVNTYGTNPLLADSDGDSFSDGIEVASGSDPLSPSSVPPQKSWVGGDPGSPTQWSNANNWSPPGVPTAGEDVLIPGSAVVDPVLTANATSRSLIVQSSATVSVGTFTLTATGNVVATGAITGTGVLQLTGAGVTLAGTMRNVTVTGTAKGAGAVMITGNLTVTNGGDLDVHGQQVVVSGNLTLPSFSNATLTMQDAAGVLNIGGSAFFDGADTQGRLTAGVLEVGGNFVVGGLNSHAFAASGTHLVVFNGTTPQAVTMSSPGVSTQRFQDMEVANAAGVNFNSSVQINGVLTLDAGATMGGTGTVTVVGNVTTAPSSSVTVGGLQIGGRMAVAGAFAPGTTTFTGTGQQIQAGLGYKSVTVTGTARFMGTTLLGGDLTVTNGGDLDVRGQQVVVSGNLTLPSFSNATLTMQDAAGVLSIGGSAFFDGADTQGRLTAGVLEVGGNFVVGGLNSHAFAASGTHLVVFNGTTPQAVTMSSPGVSTQRFQDVEVANAAGVNFNSGIQINGDLSVDAGATMGGTGSVTVLGAATTAAGSTVTVGGLQVGGVLTIGGVYRPGTATFSGTGQVIPSGSYRSVTVSGTARVGGAVTIAGNLTVNNGGDLDVRGQQVVVSGNLTLPSFSNATLTMQDAAGVLSIGGSAFFDGADTQGRLTAGVLEVGGNFVVGGLNNHAFAASGTHLVVFNGTTQQAVTMSSPGVSTQRFQDVEVANAAGVNFNSGIQINDDLSVDAGATMGGTGSVTVLGAATTAAGSTVTVGGLRVGGVLTIGGVYRPGTATFSGTGQVIPSGSYRSVTVSGTARVGGTVTITGDLTVTSGGDLDVRGQQVVVSGNLTLPSFSNATLAMQDAAGVLSIGGSAFFDGGDTQGRLTAGVLEVGGNFVVGGLNNHAFAASGTHLVVFNGTGPQSVSLSTPGVSTQRFQDVEVANAAGVSFNSGIQMNGDLTVDASAVMAGTGTVTVLGDATTAPGSTVTVGGLQVGGVLIIGGIYQPATATFSGAGQVIPPGNYKSVTVTGTARVGGAVTIAGNLTVNNGGDLDVRGQTVTVTGNFSTPSFSNATLTMQDVAGVLSVGGSAFFDGGDTQGRLTAGVLEVGGNFVVGGLNNHAFAASGTHLVVFNGTGPQSVSLSTPGVSTQRFQDVEVANAAGVTMNSTLVANGQLVSTGGTSTPLLLGGGRSLAVAGLDVDGLILDNVVLSVNGGVITGFDNVDFQNYSTSATQLIINHTAMNATFTGLTFFTTPTTGLYLQANDTDGPGTVAALTISGSSPANGLPKTATTGGFILTWLP